MIFIIEDDELMAECVAKSCEGQEVKIFSNAYDAIKAFDDKLPDLIFLDILLSGPDGFTLLHELASYSDTGNIPVVIVSSLDFSGKDLSIYGVVGAINKDTMTPKEVEEYANRYTH